MIKIFVWINIVRFWPHLLLANAKCWHDVVAYSAEEHHHGRIFTFLRLMTFNRSFRTLYYHRIGRTKYLIQWLAPGEPTFHIANTCDVASGVLFFHSYGTALNAWSIGSGCRITCNITLGDKRGMRPQIGEHVEILPGAVIAGDVKIGNNCVIGPNAVVYKSVPANCVVVGNPAYILKENGKIVNRPL